MSHTISLKIGAAMYHALTVQAMRDGQCGSESPARAYYVRKAIHTKLNKNGWSTTFLNTPDTEVPQAIENLSQGASGCAEGG